MSHLGHYNRDPGINSSQVEKIAHGVKSALGVQHKQKLDKIYIDSVKQSVGNKIYSPSNQNSTDKLHKKPPLAQYVEKTLEGLDNAI